MLVLLINPCCSSLMKHWWNWSLQRKLHLARRILLSRCKGSSELWLLHLWKGSACISRSLLLKGGGLLLWNGPTMSAHHHVWLLATSVCELLLELLCSCILFCSRIQAWFLLCNRCRYLILLGLISLKLCCFVLTVAERVFIIETLFLLIVVFTTKVVVDWVVLLHNNILLLLLLMRQCLSTHLHRILMLSLSLIVHLLHEPVLKIHVIQSNLINF